MDIPNISCALSNRDVLELRHDHLKVVSNPQPQGQNDCSGLTDVAFHHATALTSQKNPVLVITNQATTSTIRCLPSDSDTSKKRNQIDEPLAPLAPLAPLHPRKLISLDEVEAEELEWLLPNLIPLGGLTILDGDKAEGKSTLLYDFSARITSGAALPFSDGHAVSGGVILLEAEDDLGSTIKKSILAAGGLPERIRAFSKRDALHLDNPEDLRLIQQTTNEINAKLIIVNPFSEFFSRTLKDEKAIREAFRPLRALAASLKLAVVLVRHFTKSGGSALNRGLGGVAIINAARSSLMVGKDPSSEEKYRHVLAFNRGNLPRTRDVSLVYRTVKRDDAIVIEWVGESQVMADDLVYSAPGNRDDDSRLAEACYVLYSILAINGPMPATMVKKEAQKALVTEGTLKRAKKKLKVRSRKELFTIPVQVDEEDGDGDEEQPLLQVGSEPKLHWLWRLPTDEEDLLRPYRERFEREQAEDEAKWAGETLPPADEATTL
jgi:archaellum biogenesis ATPase FlaH